MKYDEPFTPEHVDEQIEYVSISQPQGTDAPNSQVIQRLHAYYDADRQSAARIWERLAQQAGEYSADAFPLETASGIQNQETRPMPRISAAYRRARRGWLVTAAASLFALLLVSSLLWVLHTASSPARQPASQVPALPAGIYINEPDGVARLDSQTHKVIWHTPIAGRNLAYGLWPAPTVIDKTVYIYYDGHLLAFNAETGAHLWSQTFNGDNSGTPPYLVNGRIVITVDAPLQSVYELDPATGTIEATHHLPQTAGFPRIVDHVLYYVDGLDASLHALQLPAETSLWQRQVIQHTGQGVSQGLGPITVADGVVYVTNRTLENAPHYLFAFDAHSGKPLWQSPTINAGFLQISIFNGIIYASTQPGNSTADEGALYAFNALTHQLSWHRKLGYINFLPTTHGLYVVNSSNTAGGHEDVLKLNPSTGKTLWQKTYQFPSVTVLGARPGEIFLAGWDIHNEVSKSVLYGLNPDNGSVLWQVPVGDWEITIV